MIFWRCLRCHPVKTFTYSQRACSSLAWWFIFLQSTLVSAVQEMLPNAKGTAMSVASFNIFVGGAIGTGINARIIEAYSVSRIYLIAAFLILITGLASSISKSEKYRKN